MALLKTNDKEADRHLAAAEAQLQVALDNMPGALVYTDDALNIVFCNDRFREMYEAPSALLQPGRAYPDFPRFLAEHGYYGPGDIDALVAKRVESLRNPSGRTFEDRTPSGRMYRIRRSRVATGGVVTVMTDITEQKKAEEDIAAKEARFHLAPNNPLRRQPGLQPACVALPATTASRPGEHLNLRDRQGEPLLDPVKVRYWQIVLQKPANDGLAVGASCEV